MVTRNQVFEQQEIRIIFDALTYISNKNIKQERNHQTTKCFKNHYLSPQNSTLPTEMAPQNPIPIFFLVQSGERRRLCGGLIGSFPNIRQRAWKKLL